MALGSIGLLADGARSRLVKLGVVFVLGLVLAVASSAQPDPVSAAKTSSKFQDFVERVALASSADRAAIVDTFLEDIESVPYIEGDSAIFIYRGGATSVSVAGDMNGWSPSIDLARLSDTDFWYAVRQYESTARLDYKLITNGTNWILDPRNPNLVSGGFGPNSELAMPGYVQPAEIEYRASIPHGQLVDSVFVSSKLGNSRRIQIYLPPGYDRAASYGMILFHDGGDYLALSSVRNVLDNLIHDDVIDPVVAVFVPPVNRNDEYAFATADLYEEFIVDEVLPWLTSDYAVSADPMQRAITGPSLGGLISAQICYRNPEAFGLCAPVSPSFWVNNQEIMNEVLDGEKRDIRFYVDWGTYETSIATTGNAFASGLEDNGYDVVWNEWYEGHSWGSWRAHLDNMLIMFFPSVTSGSVIDDEQPRKVGGLSNYPNPFSTSTTLEFELLSGGMTSIDIYDVTGRMVSQPIAQVYPPGKHRVNLATDDLPSGAYLVRLTLGDQSDVVQMILAR
ncbi:MAG: T9SS type A sorting domain-containing protein [Rhodothermales bacterium]|nr:T9SS type A sorting domain-containing protein [Rhodothermales bacterium]